MFFRLAITIIVAVCFGNMPYQHYKHLLQSNSTINHNQTFSIVTFNDHDPSDLHTMLLYLHEKFIKNTTNDHNTMYFTEYNSEQFWKFYDTAKPLKFSYNDTLMTAYFTEKNDSIAHDHNTILTYRELHIKTNGSKKVLQQLVRDAMNFKIYNRPMIYWIFDAKSVSWSYTGHVIERTIDTIYLPNNTLNNMLNTMNKFRDPILIERKNQLGVPNKHVYLFEGVPGTGKTSLIRTLASHYNMSICIFPMSKELNDEKLMIGFAQVPNKCMIVFEDIDALFVNRTKDTGTQDYISFSSFLNVLDGMHYTENEEIFMTTNHIDRLDPALIRPGRVNLIVKFDYATEDQIIQIFKAYTHPTNAQIEEFLSRYHSVSFDSNKNITISKLQEYLIDYIDQPEVAYDIDNMKTLFY